MVVILVLAGAYSFSGLPVDAVPDITNNQVQVVTVAPDLATSEVERFISFPVEQALTTIPGKIELRSLSRFGLSVVTIVFSDETDIYLARQQIAERLNEAREQIPANMGKPEMMPVTTGLGEIYQYTLKPKAGYESRFSLTDLRTIQDWIIRRQLQGTPGVADISSFGGNLKQYEVAVDPVRLRSMDIALEQVFKALEQNNQNAGGAYIEKGPSAWYIRTEGLVGSLSDIGLIEVSRTTSGVPVLVRDLAEVRIGKAIRYGAITRDTSGETVGGIVLMMKGANSSAVIRQVKERMESISSSLPEGLEIIPYLDRTKLVNNAIGTIRNNLSEGALIVVFVLVLLLGNLRAGLIVASVIPLSMLFAICMMRVFGVSGNLMSLGAIDFGLIVDGAVIIVEAVIHSLQKNPIIARTGGLISPQQLNETVRQTSGKMVRFATFGQIIILIVYLPILTLTGIEGKMFIPMAETVSFAIIGALLLSMTWVPVASSLFLNRKIGNGNQAAERMMGSLRKRYQNILSKALEYPKAILSGGVLLLVGSLLLFTRMGGEFIPVLEEGDFAVEMRLMPGSSLSHTIETTNQAAEILMKRFPEVVAVTGKIGTSEIPTDPMPPEACDLIISLKPKKEWTSASGREELAEKMQHALEEIPGVNFGFQQPIQMRFNELMTGARQDVVIKVFGDDLDTLTAIAGRVAELAKETQGASDVYLEQLNGLPQQVVKINREQLARYGIPVERVNQTVAIAFAGKVAGQVFEGEKRFDLVLRMAGEKRKDFQALYDITIPDSRGNPVPLRELADIQTLAGPVVIQRDHAQRRALVGFNARGRDVESIVQDLQARTTDEIALPAGYRIEYGGQFKNLAEARERLMVAVPMALLLIFMLLYFTFRSVKYALLIFTAVPFSVIGGVLALWMRGMPFSISAGVGFIALSGVAVLNGIVLVGMFLELRKDGRHSIRELILHGASERIRPILMTAAVASLGFLPMATSVSAGAEVQKPLATVVIGGLVTSTLLSLFLLPILFMLIEEISFKQKLNSALLLLLFIFGFSGNTIAQNPVQLSLEKAVQLSLQHHPSIRQAEQTLEAKKVLEASAWNFEPMNAQLTGGNYNSAYSDNNITISQRFPFPLSSIRQKQVYKSESGEAAIQVRLTEKQITLKTSLVWYRMRYLQLKKEILLVQDSLFERASRIAELRRTSGETHPVELLNVQTARTAILTELNRVQSDIRITEKTLQLLTGIDAPLLVPEGSAGFQRDIPAGVADSTWKNAVQLTYSKQKEKTAESLEKAERGRFFPDITAGYFNQSLTGFQNIHGEEIFFPRTTRFSGYQLGLSIPLLFNAQRARVQNAEWQRKAAIEASMALGFELKEQHQTLLSEMGSALQNLEVLQGSVLNNAETTLKGAVVAWESGEIGYLEMAFLIKEVFALRNAKLEELNRLNTAILHYEFYFQ